MPSSKQIDEKSPTFRQVTGDEPFRQWEDNRGRKMEARYTGATTNPNGKVLVLFEKPSGTTYDFPLEELSQADQNYVRKE